MREDCKPFSCDKLPRELITAYTRRSGFYNINPCILSVCNALTVVFIQSRPNAPSQQKRYSKEEDHQQARGSSGIWGNWSSFDGGSPAGTRKQSDNIADMAGNAKITVYTAKPIHSNYIGFITFVSLTFQKQGLFYKKRSQNASRRKRKK